MGVFQEKNYRSGRLHRPGLTALQVLWPTIWKRGPDECSTYLQGQRDKEHPLTVSVVQWAGFHCIVKLVVLTFSQLCLCDFTPLAWCWPWWEHLHVRYWYSHFAKWEFFYFLEVVGSYSSNMQLQLCDNGSTLVRGIPLLERWRLEYSDLLSSR